MSQKHTPMTMDEVIAVIRADQAESKRRWRGAVQDDRYWIPYAAECYEHYDDAIAALEAGELYAAEYALERASMLESEGGDNGVAHHAIGVVRAAIAKAEGR